MEDCVFCKIIDGEIPSNKVYEDDEIIVFKDIAPMAKVHLVMVPKEHYKNVTELNEARAEILGRGIMKLANIAKEMGLKDGFRIVSNVGKHGCQSVMHLHVHLLGGEQLQEKMN